MQFNIDIDDNSLNKLTSGAVDSLQKEMKKYANGIIKEAVLIEEGERREGATSEITSNIIQKAIISKKNKNTVSIKKKLGLKICKILNTIICLMTGFLFDLSGYQNNLIGLILFIVSFAIVCILTVVIVIMEE